MINSPEYQQRLNYKDLIVNEGARRQWNNKILDSTNKQVIMNIGSDKNSNTTTTTKRKDDVLVLEKQQEQLKQNKVSHEHGSSRY